MIVARRAARGVEVLVLTRAESCSFLPGYLVFPGGIIEPSDEDFAGRLFGDPGEAARACALRELFEEAGISLDASAASDLVEVARWVAPELLEVRFDARFFAAAAPARVDPTPDGVEISAAEWARPAEVLDAVERGDAKVFWPTLVTMKALAGCRRVEDVLALHVEQIPSPEAAR